MKKYIVIGAIALTLVGCGLSEATPTENDTDRLNENANGNKAESPTGPSPVKNVISGGDWEVGTKEDIAAGVITRGTYVITATEDGFFCGWSTVRNFEETGNYIIAVGSLEPGQTGRVTVGREAKGLRLQGDCIAKKK